MPGMFKDLVAWQLSMELVKDIYKITRGFPADERFGLVSQLRRSAISVPSNIAEGAARNTGKDFTRFLYIARGSLAEVQTQILISAQMGLLEDSLELEAEIERIHAVLQGLIRKTSSSPPHHLAASPP